MLPHGNDWDYFVTGHSVARFRSVLFHLNEMDMLDLGLLIKVHMFGLRVTPYLGAFLIKEFHEDHSCTCNP